MNELMRELCVFSIFSAVASAIVPEGGAKRVMGIVISAVMLCITLESVTAIDFDSYRLMAAKYRETGMSLTAEAENVSDRLNRLVIERECEEYIYDRAAKFGTELSSVRVTASWHPDGLWLPSALEIGSAEARNDRLCSAIEAELGIPTSEQVWKNER